MKVLIIGGCGYIGSSIYQYLKEKKVEVDSIDLEWFENPGEIKNYKIDFFDLEKSFLNQYNTIVLCAGHSSVPLCENYKIDCINNNIYKFVSLVEKLEEQKKFIYMSSSCVYNGLFSAKENSILNPPSDMLSLSKSTIDYYILNSSKNYYALRLGSVHGMSPNTRRDLVVNAMVIKAISDKEIILYNSDNIKPLVGLSDISRVVHSIITSDKDRPGVYNISSINITIKEIADTISNTLENINIVDNGYKKNYSFTMDNTKFINTYNFEYKHTIEKSIKQIVEMYSKPTTKFSDRNNYQ